jgi:hypothetical protein
MPLTREEQEQAAVVEWSLLYNELRWLHHIPNGKKRSKGVAGQLKAMGVKAGVADLFLPIAKPPYHGLYIEMKNPFTRSTQTEGQKEFQVDVELQGYRYVVARGAGEGISAIKEYLGW